MRYRLAQVQHIARPRQEVFAFFSDAANLERLTPAFLKFKISTPLPIVMRVGTLIDYTIRLNGIPLRWRTRIDEFEPNVRFVDTQLRGPYKYWHHVHEFCDAASGTQMLDAVDYELPLGPLGQLAHALFVRRQLETIFGYRRHAVSAIFADTGTAGGSAPTARGAEG